MSAGRLEVVVPVPILMVVIYDHPSDFPEHWVVRSWEVTPGQLKPSQVGALFKDLDVARAWIAQECPQLQLVQPPGVDPDPVVYEVYA